MAIRPAVPDDVPALARVHVRAWQAAYTGLVPQEFLDAMDPAEREPRWRQRLDEFPPPGAVLVWTEGTVPPAGFVAVMPSRDPDADPETGEVGAIYLLPSFQGRGVGRELMAAAVEHLTAAGFRQATLWVLASNVRARRFYEAAGWRPDGMSKVDDLRGFPLEEVRYRRTLTGSQGLRPTAP
ncbi:N-acetyltransferase [Actinoplanes italicus]|uniref:L-amino acid N-acyltransferase YncA n=1 Tax=Actinoplanes italicus TaxID=113567 RepID=A0A2T0K9S8_9ACTN|nr:GNAT family N-acetyltransferase [Actinoplanes italicus]PRX19870.1 L-amino acid N-acyltransferase YncA [Actinoplanes italicus]GIE31722.1 N-acetyltransferase [Actinoplanes italicus]